jgi:hypothetical protein
MKLTILVDNTTFVPYNEKRYAPKLLSKNAYGMGTVWVMDALHMPYGCSVWPAFWTRESERHPPIADHGGVPLPPDFAPLTI